MPSSTRAAAIGIVYALVVFACAFALGTLRVFLLVPRVGETAGVLIEVPLLLAISWIACLWCVQRFEVSPLLPHRAAMGAAAFAVVMGLELATSTFVFQRSFALMPLVRGVPTMRKAV